MRDEINDVLAQQKAMMAEAYELITSHDAQDEPISLTVESELKRIFESVK